MNSNNDTIIIIGGIRGPLNGKIIVNKARVIFHYSVLTYKKGSKIVLKTLGEERKKKCK